MDKSAGKTLSEAAAFQQLLQCGRKESDSEYERNNGVGRIARAFPRTVRLWVELGFYIGVVDSRRKGKRVVKRVPVHWFVTISCASWHRRFRYRGWLRYCVALALLRVATLAPLKGRRISNV